MLPKLEVKNISLWSRIMVRSEGRRLKDEMANWLVEGIHHGIRKLLDGFSPDPWPLTICCNSEWLSLRIPSFPREKLSEITSKRKMTRPRFTSQMVFWDFLFLAQIHEMCGESSLSVSLLWISRGYLQFLPTHTIYGYVQRTVVLRTSQPRRSSHVDWPGEFRAILKDE